MPIIDRSGPQHRRIYNNNSGGTLLWLSSAVDLGLALHRSGGVSSALSANFEPRSRWHQQTQHQQQAHSPPQRRSPFKWHQNKDNIIGDFDDEQPKLWFKNHGEKKILKEQVAFRKSSDWTLFCEPDEGPRGTDVVQGALEDCFFIQSLAAVAHANPRMIMNNIEQTRLEGKDGPGKEAMYGFSVVFYGWNLAGGVDKYFVRIDEQISLPGRTPDGSLIPKTALAIPCGNAQSPGNGKLIIWPQMFEKAYAKFVDRKSGTPSFWPWGKKGFQLIAEGGWAMGSIFHITGFQDFAKFKLEWFRDEERTWKSVWSRNGRRGTECPVIATTSTNRNEIQNAVVEKWSAQNPGLRICWRPSHIFAVFGGHRTLEGVWEVRVHCDAKQHVVSIPMAEFRVFFDTLIIRKNSECLPDDQIFIAEEQS
ncbi:hypothetical protein HK102_013017 [Quaeritorhiza haematococci]|nr:hypothetical protein HK102_013017 [Quaeritorhiza haematococci]